MSKFLYKQVKSAGTSKRKFNLHKEWTITDETSGSYGVYVYEGLYSNGSFTILQTTISKFTSSMSRCHNTISNIWR